MARPPKMNQLDSAPSFCCFVFSCVIFIVFFVLLLPVLIIVNLCFYFSVFIPALVLPFYSFYFLSMKIQKLFTRGAMCSL